eukprot:CAMPEP_0172599146 /NCGR_PEP_ID=MMETSP1068-20121228/19230_1 /TAXON_ID=35684 /ORGANISM="Pseudopedinella elastica, Strain CCMP716" /LENGTH=73 /DNA_ID=CAMNT_0013399301 /DNA_START=27 /DNA_END=244 /DNA_ORIENTATION=-
MVGMMSARASARHFTVLLGLVASVPVWGSHFHALSSSAPRPARLGLPSEDGARAVPRRATACSALSIPKGGAT